MELNINDKVLINMPLQAGFISKSGTRREYNHKLATITEVHGDSCRLSIDGGKFNWPKTILAKPVQR